MLHPFTIYDFSYYSFLILHLKFHEEKFSKTFQVDSYLVLNNFDVVLDDADVNDILMQWIRKKFSIYVHTCF